MGTWLLTLICIYLEMGYSMKKGKELVFLNVNDFEYPGANLTLKRVHREQWEEYYRCLREQFSKFGPNKSLLPIPLMVFEGTSLTLKCPICLSPSELHRIEAVEWYFKRDGNLNSKSEQVQSTEHLLISPDGDLNMYYIQLDQTGQYWCQLGDDAIAPPYYLDVDNGSEPILIVHPNKSSKPSTIHSQPPITIIPEYNLKVYSSWTKWSPCSTCGEDVVGIKVKYGYCTISLLENSKNNTVKNLEEGSEEETKYEAEDDKMAAKRTEEKYNRDVKQMVNSILPIFRNKMPCRSRNTPLEIQNIKDIKTRKSEIVQQFCKVTCPKNEMFQVRDKYGNILENANNSGGIYSFIQGVPDLIPTATRVTLYRQYDKECQLKCPGNLNSDAPFVWKVGSKILIPSIIEKQSRGRIQISVQQIILITQLHFADKNIYSCWQENQLAGIIKLEISREIQIEINHQIAIIGSIAIMAVFLKIFWKAYTGRKRFTMH